MLLNEFFDKEPKAYQDLSQDNSQPELGDLRKSRLTLRQLNKLRMMNDVRRKIKMGQAAIRSSTNANGLKLQNFYNL